MSGRLVLVEVVGGVPDRVSLEALGFARSLGGPVDAAVVGAPGVGVAAAGLGAYGVSTAYVVEDPRLAAYGPAAVASGLAAIVAAGGWMASSVVCEADPDCPEEEQCREVPAPPGGIPYRQCIPR